MVLVKHYGIYLIDIVETVYCLESIPSYFKATFYALDLCKRTNIEHRQIDYIWQHCLSNLVQHCLTFSDFVRPFKLLKFVQTCPNLSNLFQTCSKLFKTCSNSFKLVQTCSNLFKLVQTCTNLFKLVQIGLDLSKQL